MRLNIKQFKLKYGSYSRPVRIIITLGLLYLIFSKVEIYRLIEIIYKINFIILIPLLLYIPSLILNSTRFYQIINKRISQKELFKINWISAFFSNFLPSNIGGDSYKFVTLRKRLGNQFTLESVMIDRISGVLSIIILSCISSIIIYLKIRNLLLSLLPWIIMFVLFILLKILKQRKFKIFKKYILDIDKYKNKLLNPKIIINSIAYTSFGAVSLFFYYLMFGYNLNFFIILGFYCFIQLLNMIPISINAIGVQEAGSVYFFSLIGIPAEVSLTVSIISRIVMVFQTSIGGLIYFFEK